MSKDNLMLLSEIYPRNFSQSERKLFHLSILHPFEMNHLLTITKCSKCAKQPKCCCTKRSSSIANQCKQQSYSIFNSIINLSHRVTGNMAVDHHKSRNNNNTSINSYHGFHAGTSKNDNCCNDSGNYELKLDQNKCISCLCLHNTNLSSINGNNNGNVNNIAINNTNDNANNSTNSLGAQLVQVNNTRNENQCPNIVSQCHGVKNNIDGATLPQIASFKEKVAAIERGNNANNKSVDIETHNIIRSI